jgi:carbon monoxide dehydrogenase subunit G
MNFMAEVSKFESRAGSLTSSAKEVFDFVTDIRNFQRFVPAGSINSLQVEKETCSFQIPPVGSVKFRLSEKEPYNKVVFSGNALNTNDFSLFLNIKSSDTSHTEVRLILNAEMNPILKMMAARPIARFLETLIDEMEKFKGWNDTKA